MLAGGNDGAWRFCAKNDGVVCLCFLQVVDVCRRCRARPLKGGYWFDTFIYRSTTSEPARRVEARRGAGVDAHAVAGAWKCWILPGRYEGLPFGVDRVLQRMAVMTTFFWYRELLECEAKYLDDADTGDHSKDTGAYRECSFDEAAVS